MIYHASTTNIHKVLNKFNVLTPLIQFSMEKESGNRINFLHIANSKDENNIQFAIYRKHTVTDIIIPYDSYHTPEHKLETSACLTKPPFIDLSHNGF